VTTYVHYKSIAPFCKTEHISLQTNLSFPTDKLRHPNKAKVLVNVSKISLKAFIVLAIYVYNFVHFNQEPWESTSKVVIESFRKRSYQFLISKKK